MTRSPEAHQQTVSDEHLRQIVEGPQAVQEAVADEAQAVAICYAALGSTIPLRPALAYQKTERELNQEEIRRTQGGGDLAKIRALRDEIARLQPLIG